MTDRSARYPIWGMLFWAPRVVVGILVVTEVSAGEGPRVTQSPQLVWLSAEVSRWQRIEGRIDWPKQYRNPFDPNEVAVDLLVTAPDGSRFVQPAFWMEDFVWRPMGRDRGGEWFYPQGQPTWWVRVTPTVAGVYEARVRVRDRQGVAESAVATFHCRDAPGRGFLRVAKGDPRYLAFDDGTPFFAIGQNLAFIGSSSQYLTLSGAIEAFRKLAENGANYLRIWTCCEDWALCLEGRKSAWSRSWAWRPPWIDRPAEVPPAAFAPPSPFAGLACEKVIPLTSQPLRPDPSHRVGVLPKTGYRFSVALFARRPAEVVCQVLGQSVVFQVGKREVNRWVVKETQVTSAADAVWLGPLEISLRGDKGSQPAAYLGGISLRDTTTDRELLWEAEIARPEVGRYNPVDAFMLDQLVMAAEQTGIYLQLCLLTRDLYMYRLKDPASPAYHQAVADAKRTFRYAVARWGYSPHVAAWEYWNELDPGLPTDPFYEELGQYLEKIDPYRHLRTTSTWGPSPKDCRHPRLEIAEVHYYLRPTDRKRIPDEVAAVLDRAAFLREHAPQKPVLLGEFGLADDQWREDPQMPQDRRLLHFHNALWASVFSGLSGTAMFWWWDQLDRMNAYPHYRPVAQFVAEVPWTREPLQSVMWRDESAGLRVLGLTGKTAGYYWIIRDRGTWLSRVRNEPPCETGPAEITLPGLPAGKYHLQWWDTWQGKPVQQGSATLGGSERRLATPEFTEDIAVIARQEGS